MPTLPKATPSSIRFNKLTPSGRQIAGSEVRPYLVSASSRRRDVHDEARVALSERSFALFAHESEDAKLTGSTRSLYRRLLALNLPADQAEAGTGKPSASVVNFSSRIASA